jgi:hypothetical protein
MAYVGNGIYDLLDVIKASARPEINYEGLYQDPPSNIATSNLFKAMQPGYEYRNQDFIDNAMRTGGYDLEGNVPVDFNRRTDFRRYFENKPLRPTDGVARYTNFNPRVGTTSEYPFKSMNELKNFQDNYYLPDQPVTSLGFDTSYGVANEPDVAQVPLPGQNQGIPFATQAKNFVTNTLPNFIKGGLSMIPGVSMIQRLDKFDTLPYLDKQFIKSNMQGGVPGIYVDPRTGLLKDQRGKNVRSLLGNYAESIEEDYEKLSNQLEKSKKNYTEKYGGLDIINEYGKNWSEMNKNNLNNFEFLTNMKSKKDKQERDFLDKVKAQVKAGVTAKIGQSLHGGNDGPKGDGGNKGNIGSDGADYSSAGKTGAKAGFGYGL